MKDKVSVIIPTYGKPDRLKTAIQSVCSQDYDNVEIIVVDDNDPETEYRSQTESIMLQFRDERVVYLKHPRNMNGAAARNTGIMKANGEYICFLDSDDFYLTNRISDSVKYLNSNPQKMAVCCGVVIVTNSCLKGLYEIDCKNDFCKELIQNTSLLGTGSNIFLRRECFEELIGFDETFQRYQDVEFMLRLSSRYEVGIIKQPGVVKVNSGMHSINYIKLKDASEYFTKKFDYMLLSLSVIEQQMFRDKINKELLQAAIFSGSFKNVQQVSDRITQTRDLNKDELIQINSWHFIYCKHKIKEKIINLCINTGILPIIKARSIRIAYLKFSDKMALEIKKGIKGGVN